MGDGNLLSLRWNNHIKNFKLTLGQLLQRDLYSDATIACEGNFYPVHKFVLSTCSDYFASMFERTPCKHPVIVLKDTSSRDVEYLLSYMYGGEVSVGQADLPSLIRAAETLQIKGLVAPDDSPASPGVASKGGGSEKDPGESSPKRPRMESSLVTVDDDDEEDKENTTADIKTEAEDRVSSPSEVGAEGKDEEVPEVPFVAVSTPSAAPVKTDFYESGDFLAIQVKQEGREELAMVDLVTSQEGISYGSNPCHSTIAAGDSNSSTSSSVWPSSFLSTMSTVNNSGSLIHQSNSLHSSREPSETGEEYQTKVKESPPKSMESIVSPSDSFSSLGGVSMHSSTHNFRCPLCDYVTHNRSWLYIHLRKHTGEKPFSCPYCSFRSAQKGNLNVHIKKLHPLTPEAQARGRAHTLIHALAREGQSLTQGTTAAGQAGASSPSWA